MFKNIKYIRDNGVFLIYKLIDNDFECEISVIRTNRNMFSNAISSVASAICKEYKKRNFSIEKNIFLYIKDVANTHGYNYLTILKWLNEDIDYEFPIENFSFSDELYLKLEKMDELNIYE